MSTGARKPARKPASVDSVCSEAVLPSRLEERPGDLPVNLSHAVLANTARLWDPGEVLTYSFLAGTENQKKKVSQVIPEWALYANITFRELDEGDMFAKIRINFDENKGSWSYVGREILRTDVTGKPTMNFGWIMDTTTLTANERGTILHEFGHTLGLMHEHQSPSRKQDLPLIESAVYDHYQWTQGWTYAQIKAQILDVYETQTMSNYSALDTTSIMMYSMPGVVNEQGLAIPTNNQLSDTDKAWMVVNYTRPQPADDAFAKKWTLDHALDVLQVSNSDRNDILNAVNVVHRRTIFSNYLAKKRLESEGLHPLSGVSKETIGRQNTIRTGSQAGPQAGLFVFDDPAFKTVVCNVVHQAIANSEATVSKLAKQYLQSYSPDTNKLCERIQADLKDETETVLSSTEDATKLKISPQQALFGGLVSAVGGFLKHPLVKEIASEVASRVVKAAVGLLSQSAINDVANGITPNSITLPKQLLASMTANVEDAFDTAAAKLDTRPTASRAQNPVAVPNIFHALQKSIKSTTDSNAVKNILNDLATSIAPELIKQASVRPIDDVLRQAFVQSLTANTTIDGLASDLVKKYPKEMQDLKIQTVVSIALKDAAKEPLKALARGEMAVATPNGMQDQLKANIKRSLQGKASPSSGIKPRPTPIPSDNPLSFVAEDVLQLLNTPSKRAAAATLLSLCTRRASADISMAAGVTKDLSVTYIDAVLAQYEGLHAFLAGTVSSEPSHSLSEEPQHDILSSVLSGAADILTDAKMRSAISNLVHTAIDIAGAKILELFKEARPVKAEQLRTILSENVENVSSNLSKPGSIFQDVDPSVQSGIFDWVKKTVSTVVNNPVVRQVAGAVVDVVSEVGPIVVPLLLAQNPDAEAQDVAKELQRSVTIAMTQAGAAKRVKQSK